MRSGVLGVVVCVGVTAAGLVAWLGDAAAAAAPAGPVVPIVAPQVGVDDGGGLVVVWQTYEPHMTRGRVIARSGSGVSGFGPAQVLSHLEQDASSPQLAVNAAGDAVAVWSEDRVYQYGNSEIRMPFGVWGSVRHSGARFGTPVRLLAPGVDHDAPTVGIDGRGNALVAFVAEGVAYVVSRPAGGHFGAPVAVAGGRYGLGNNAPYSQLLVAPSGAALLRSLSGSDAPEVQVSPAGGSFDTPKPIAGMAVAAVGSRGDALAISGTAQPHRSVAVTYRPPGGQLVAPVHAADYADPAAARLDASGRGLVVIYQGPVGNRRVEAATTTPAGTVGSFAPLANAGNGDDQAASLAVADSGQAIFVWERHAPIPGLPGFFMPPEPELALGSTTGGLGAGQPLLDPSTQALNAAPPVVAISNRAVAAVVWDDARRGAMPLAAVSETLTARTYSAAGAGRTLVVTQSTTERALGVGAPFPPAASTVTIRARPSRHGLLGLATNCGADDGSRCLATIVIRLQRGRRAVTLGTRHLRLFPNETSAPPFLFVRLTRQALELLRATHELRATVEIVTHNPRGRHTAIDTPLVIRR